MDQKSKNYILVVNTGDDWESFLEGTWGIQLSKELQMDASAFCSERRVYPSARGFIIVLELPGTESNSTESAGNNSRESVRLIRYRCCFSSHKLFHVAEVSAPSVSNSSDLRVSLTFVHQLVHYIPFHEMTTREVEICEHGGERNVSNLWVAWLIGFLMAYRFRVEYRGSCRENGEGQNGGNASQNPQNPGESEGGSSDPNQDQEESREGSSTSPSESQEQD